MYIYTCPLWVLAAEVCVEWHAATSTILLNESQSVTATVVIVCTEITWKV